MVCSYVFWPFCHYYNYVVYRKTIFCYTLVYRKTIFCYTLVYRKTIFLSCWDSYSQVPLKLRLNASSRHGDTLPSVFSINKKRFAIFWQSSISAPRGDRTRIAGSADQGLTHYTIWAVDKNATYLDIYISNMRYIYLYVGILILNSLKNINNYIKLPRGKLKTN